MTPWSLANCAILACLAKLASDVDCTSWSNVKTSIEGSWTRDSGTLAGASINGAGWEHAFLRSCFFIFRHDGSRIVVSHDSMRSERDIVSRLDNLVGSEADSILLSDLLGKILGDGGGGRSLEGLVESGVGSALELRMKCLPPRADGSVRTGLGDDGAEGSRARGQGSGPEPRDGGGIERNGSPLHTSRQSD